MYSNECQNYFVGEDTKTSINGSLHSNKMEQITNIEDQKTKEWEEMDELYQVGKMQLNILKGELPCGGDLP